MCGVLIGSGQHPHIYNGFQNFGKKKFFSFSKKHRAKNIPLKNLGEI